MAGSRTHARGFQPVPSVTEKCYPVRLFRRTVSGPSLPVPTVFDPSVTKCDTRRGAVERPQKYCSMAPMRPLLSLALALCAVLATARNPASSSNAPAQPVLLPRSAVLDLAAVRHFFPQVAHEAQTGRDTTAQGTPNATRAVFFESGSGSKRVTLTVDSYANAGAASSAYATALKKSKIPGFKPLKVPNVGDKTFAGTVTVGSETHVGIGVLLGNLVVGATLAGFDSSRANVTQLVEMTRAEIALVSKLSSGG